MKKLLPLLFSLFLLASFQSKAQSTAPADPLKRSGWFISPRIGYDILPMYKNNTPYSYFFSIFGTLKIHLC